MGMAEFGPSGTVFAEPILWKETMPTQLPINQDSHNESEIKDTSIWVCPADETINTGEYCIICGCARPIEVPARPAKAPAISIKDAARQCSVTAYAKAQGSFTGAVYSWWWLRSPGYRQDTAAYVDYDGSVDYDGGYVDRDFFAVRPGLWINLDS